MVEDSKVIRGLQESSLFQNLDDQALFHISEKAAIVPYNPEEVIVTEGEPSDRLFIILNGIVTVKRISADKPDKVFAYLMPGNSFGEVGILENKPRSATVTAMTNVELLVFQRDYFLDVLHQFPTIAVELAKLLGHYLTESNKRLARGDKDKKVVLVFDLFDTHGAAELGKRMAIKLMNSSDKSTIYAEYPFRDNLSADLHLQKNSKVYHHDSGLDIMLHEDKRNRLVSPTMALLVDNLLDDYENLVIYLNKDFKEDINQVIENIDQVIIVGSNQKSHWRAISELHGEIKSGIKNQNTKIFTILINNDPQQSLTLSPPPDFKVMFSNDTTNYQLWADGNSKLASESFHTAVETFVDRLQRNHNLGIFIPTTFDVNVYVDTSPYIDKTLSFLGERFGGATSEEAKGIWNSEDIGLVGEKLFKVHTYATSNDIKKYLDEVVEYVRQIKSELRQEAMAIEINQKLTLV